MAVTSDMIDQLDTAILKIATGAQSYTLSDGTMVTKANLSEVSKLRDRWKMELSAQQGSAGFMPVEFVSANPCR